MWYHGTYLIDLIVAEVLAIWDIFTAHGVVHVGLDAAWSDAVDGDLLVAAVNGHAADESLNGTL